MAALHRPALPAPRILGRVGGGRLFIYAVIALAVIVALAQVNQFSRLTSTGYEIEALKRERDTQLARNHKIEAEVASLASLARVDLEARLRLHMEPAQRRLYIDVNAPAPEDQTLPTRFLPPESAAAAEEPAGESQPWWRRVAGWLNPF